MQKISDRISNFILTSNLLILFLLAIIVFEVVLFFSLNSNFELHFLDVGQGDSILIRTPGYHYILIDTGESNKVISQLSEVLPFWERKIDLLIATHSHNDHIGGIEYVLSKYDVGTYLFSYEESTESLIQKVSDKLDNEGVQKIKVYDGSTITISNLSLDILWPPYGLRSENKNEESIVIKGKYNDFTFLLTGDAEAKQEKEILRKNSNLQSIVLKAGHHGSKSSSNEDFLKNVNCTYFIISCGEGNKFNHPSPETLNKIDLGTEILRTDKNGRITFILDKEELYKFTER